MNSININKTKVNQTTVIYNDAGDKKVYITVTEWDNGEGYDVSIEDGNRSKIFSLGYDDISAINLCINMLNLRITE